jgi:hypothetical protein
MTIDTSYSDELYDDFLSDQLVVEAELDETQDKLGRYLADLEIECAMQSGTYGIDGDEDLFELDESDDSDLFALVDIDDFSDIFQV